MNAPRTPRTPPCAARPTPILAATPLALAILTALLLLAAGCAAVRPGAGPIRDLARLPQSASAYVDPATADAPLLDAAASEALAAAYLREHFGPWDRTAPAHGPEEVFAFLREPEPERWASENLAPRTPAWFAALRTACEPEAYPNAAQHAVAVRGTSMRVLPTDQPAFRPFGLPGEGYPFDYLQNTAVWAQTPIFVSHYSRDGAWALCETRFAYGWIPVRDLALVDEEAMRALRVARFLTFTRDRVPLADDFGLFRCLGRVGMVLPCIGEEDGGLRALILVRDAMGAGELRSVLVPGDAARPFPLPPTPAAFARQADAILGQPYGWGGLYGHRDCSALVMDLYAGFGIALPRNSSRQARSGPFTPLDGLADAGKAALVAGKAKPWLTLLWRPGHIMVYLGLRDGEPVILHAAWGLKTERGGREGRRVIGAAVITGLAPGLELPDLKHPDGVLLHALAGMTRVAAEIPQNPDADATPAPENGAQPCPAPARPSPLPRLLQ